MSGTATRTRDFIKEQTADAPERAGGGPDWLQALRDEALARLNRDGLPTPRDEEWRNTNFAPITGMRFVAPAEAQADSDFATLDWVVDPAARLTFSGGRYQPASDTPALPDGVRVGSMKALLEAEPDLLRDRLRDASREEPTSFEALNTAMFEDGVAIVVPDGVTIERPIQVIHGTTEAGEPRISHPRTLLIAGRRSRVCLVETFVGVGTYLTNAVGEMLLDDEAQVEHYRIQLESETAYHISTQVSRQGRDSRYTQHNVNLGGKLVRHNLRGVMAGEGGYCDLLGLSVIGGEQHVDNHTILDHAVPHCGSREVYKGILSGRSRSIFKGRIIVREDAQQTDAKQSNPNLLLSTEAQAHTRPQLEIYADDVKCTHGTTIGRLDDDAIFYLRSRGIPATEARRMMVGAFAREVVDRMELDTVRAAVEAEVDRRLPGRED